jgi:hypothetical protein
MGSGITLLQLPLLVLEYQVALPSQEVRLAPQHALC